MSNPHQQGAYSSTSIATYSTKHDIDTTAINRTTRHNVQPSSSSSTSAGQVQQEKVVVTTRTVLTLGDGDFTYSLDFARYWANHNIINQGNTQQKNIHLIASGIDTYDELMAKYKDTPFVLGQLLMLQQQSQKQQSSSLAVDYDADDDNNNQSSPSPSLTVSIRHGVNAIVSSSYSDNLWQEDKSSPPPPATADCVVFHHPHIGTEDAARHGRFLCHLFYSVRHRWLKRNNNNNDNICGSSSGTSIFCVTLVNGQFERWKCAQAAERHGFVLVDRRRFRPPPLPPSIKPAYHFRRHQTGKSFEARRPNSGSETFTYYYHHHHNRQGDDSTKTDDQEEIAKRSKLLLFSLFPWQEHVGDDETKNNGEKSSISNNKQQQQQQPPLLSCPHCDKTFKEERSRKCHLRDKHPNGADKKQKSTENSLSSLQQKQNNGNDDLQSSFPCTHCDRLFERQQSLQDHVRAKHSAIHKTVLPDWHNNHDNNNNNSQGQQQQHKQQVAAAVAGDGNQDSSKGNLDDTTAITSGVGDCPVCGLVYRSEAHRQGHHMEFVPSQEEPSHVCEFCAKTFREKRAKLQHENFCSKRPGGA